MLSWGTIRHNSGWTRKALISVLVLAIGLLHFVPLPGHLGTHFMHRELFFFPLMLASFWFGIKGGVLTAMAVSIVYVLYFALHGGREYDLVTVVASQVVVFLSVGLMLGWLVDRHERRRRERDVIKDTFGKYFPEELRDEILQGRIPMAGEIRDVTMLFADLRNFTAMVEKREARMVVSLMNRYFAKMTDAIRANGGLVLQFIGDEIEAVFGAPLPVEDHPDRAVAAALQMRGLLKQLNEELGVQGIEPLQHGIGVHSGKVLAGNIGSPELLSYAMVGKTVNLASRIQDVNKLFHSDILVSAETQARLLKKVPLVRELPIEVKGIDHPVVVYRVLPSDFEPDTQTQTIDA